MAEATKQSVLKMIERMPDNASIEDIMYELYVHSRVERGLREVANGRTVPHEEVVRNMQKWLESAGH